VIKNNTLQADPIHTIPFISNKSEEGLMGIAKDPDYENNRYIYTAYAYTDGENMRVRVVRFTDL
jgi:glucose/arabinose dehydrogenase